MSALTPICFVSLIQLYKEGLEKLDQLSEDTLKIFYSNRETEIANIMEMQFVLSYLGNISKTDSDEMTPFELQNWFNLLKKQKELEAKRAAENAQ